MSHRHQTLTRFGLNVRRRREAIGLSQEALAEKAELDRTYISGIERGMRNPTILSAARVAAALKTSLAQLVERRDEMNRRRSSKASKAKEEASEYGRTRPLRFVDLFCGIGGFRIAFERTVFTDVFGWRDGRWQAVNAQENAVRKPALKR